MRLNSNKTGEGWRRRAFALLRVLCLSAFLWVPMGGQGEAFSPEDFNGMLPAFKELPSGLRTSLYVFMLEGEAKAAIVRGGVYGTMIREDPGNWSAFFETVDEAWGQLQALADHKTEVEGRAPLDPADVRDQRDIFLRYMKEGEALAESLPDELDEAYAVYLKWKNNGYESTARWISSRTNLADHPPYAYTQAMQMVENGEPRGVELLWKLAVDGHEPAIPPLAEALLAGDLVKRDRVSAHYWMSEGLRLGLDFSPGFSPDPKGLVADFSEEEMKTFRTNKALDLFENDRPIPLY